MAAGADRLEQEAHAVEIDAVALFEIGLGFARDDGRQMKNQLGRVGDKRRRLARHRDIAGADRDA